MALIFKAYNFTRYGSNLNDSDQINSISEIASPISIGGHSGLYLQAIDQFWCICYHI